MDERIKRLLRWSEGATAPCYSISIHPTIKCNLNCRFCYLREREIMDLPPPDELSDERWLRLIDEGAEHGVRYWVIIGGGEPLVRKKLTHAMMLKICQLGMNGSIITNGTLFDERMASDLTRVGWERVQFSIDAPDANSSDQLRGVEGAFDLAIKGLQLFKEAKQAAGTSLPETQIWMVLSKANYDRIDEMILMAAKTGASELNINPLRANRFAMDLIMDAKANKEFQQRISEYEKLADSLGLKTNLKDYQQQRELVELQSDLDEFMSRRTRQEADNHPFLRIPCYEPFHHIQINADGFVGPCCTSYDEFRQENIRDKTLDQVWLGDYLTGIRSALISGKLPGFCQRCPANEIIENQRIREGLREYLLDSGIEAFNNTILAQRIFRMVRRGMNRIKRLLKV